MSSNAVERMKGRLWRRILVRSAMCALWAAGLVFISLQEGQGISGGTYWYMLFGIMAIWAASTVRDVRRLRDEPTLRKAAIEATDERNVLIAYKATRLTVVGMACLLPVAMLALAYLGRHDLVDALGFAVCAFLVVYVASWFFVSRKC